MFNRRLTLILAVVMIAALIVPGYAFGADYEGHWAEGTIKEWFGDKRISGYEDGSFRPEDSVTRAEFMTMVNSVYGFEKPAEISFADAAAEKWYYEEIQKAVGAGYIAGDDKNTVRPESEITRQEAAVVIARLNDLEQNKDVSRFEDKNEIAGWASGYVGAAAEAGYMIGDDNNNFSPADYIKRAEALVTLDRAMKDKNRDKYASINELSIEGAELERAFDSRKTVYQAAAANASKVTLTADAAPGVKLDFSSAGNGSSIDVKTASSAEGGAVYTADVTLSDSKDTIVGITASREGLENRVYTVTIKKEQ